MVDMADEDRLTIEAAGLLRGDLSDLRPDTYQVLDGALNLAMCEGDPTEAARLIREIAESAHLRARLDRFVLDLSGGQISSSQKVRGDGGFDALPGDPGEGSAVVWTCPELPAGHFLRLQRMPGQLMGVCTMHGTPLVYEDQDR
jgi:hypothetical protein